MAGKENKAKSDGKSKQAVRKPLRSTMAAFGVGLAWAALHVPTGGMGLHESHIGQITWLIHAFVAALLALCVLEIAGAVLGWMLNMLATLVTTTRRE